MKRSKKTPAPKKTKPASKKGATTNDAAPKDAAITATAPKDPKPRDPRLPAPGATLEREFKGKTYRLKFLDEGGVEVDGKVFSSLSAAARHVTGAASINGFLWAGLVAREAKPANAKASKPVAPTTRGDEVDLSTPEGQRAALAAAGITKRPKGTPEQIASAAKARVARAAKKARRAAR